MEFFQNIWLWLVQNKDAIIMAITSVDLISLITAVVLLVKAVRSSKDNTASAKSLNQTINAIKDVPTKIASIEEVQKKQTEMLEELIELENLLMDKINLLFEAQLAVWSTIKDDAIRTNVTNILTSAKHNNTSTIVNLKNEIVELKDKLLLKAKELEKDIKVSIPEKSIKKNKEIVKRV
jgi:L-rhamnose isomerase